MSNKASDSDSSSSKNAEINMFWLRPKMMLGIGVITAIVMSLIMLLYILVPKYYPKFIYTSFKHPSCVTRAYMIHGDRTGEQLLHSGNRKQTLASLYEYIDSGQRDYRIRAAGILSQMKLPEADLPRLRRKYDTIFVQADIEERLSYAGLAVDLRLDPQLILIPAIELLSFADTDVIRLAQYVQSAGFDPTPENQEALRRGMLSSPRTGQSRRIPMECLTLCPPHKQWVDLLSTITWCSSKMIVLKEGPAAWYLNCLEQCDMREICETRLNVAILKSCADVVGSLTVTMTQKIDAALDGITDLEIQAELAEYVCLYGKGPIEHAEALMLEFLQSTAYWRWGMAGRHCAAHKTTKVIEAITRLTRSDEPSVRLRAWCLLDVNAHTDKIRALIRNNQDLLGEYVNLCAAGFKLEILKSTQLAMIREMLEWEFKSDLDPGLFGLLVHSTVEDNDCLDLKHTQHMFNYVYVSEAGERDALVAYKLYGLQALVLSLLSHGDEEVFESNDFEYIGRCLNERDQARFKKLSVAASRAELLTFLLSITDADELAQWQACLKADSQSSDNDRADRAKRLMRLLFPD